MIFERFNVFNNQQKIKALEEEANEEICIPSVAHDTNPIVNQEKTRDLWRMSIARRIDILRQLGELHFGKAREAVFHTISYLELLKSRLNNNELAILGEYIEHSISVLIKMGNDWRERDTRRNFTKGLATTIGVGLSAVPTLVDMVDKSIAPKLIEADPDKRDAILNKIYGGYSQTDNDTKFAELKNNLEDTYGIHIMFGDDANNKYTSGNNPAIRDKRIALAVLGVTLAQYPKSFFWSKSNKKIHGITIRFINNLKADVTFDNNKPGGNKRISAAGLNIRIDNDTKNTPGIIVANLTRLIDTVNYPYRYEFAYRGNMIMLEINHEIMHQILSADDVKMINEAMSKYQEKAPVKYGIEESNKYGTGKMNCPSYFINEYAIHSPEEDFATLGSYMMDQNMHKDLWNKMRYLDGSDNAEDKFAFSILMRKYYFVRRVIQSKCPEMNDAYWSKMLGLT